MLLQKLFFLLLMGLTSSVFAQKLVDPLVIPFEWNNDKIHFDVMVNGKGPFLFMFDTGASGEGRIDSALVAQLSIPIIGQTGNSDGVNVNNVDVANVASMNVGHYERKQLELLSRNYNRNLRAGAKPTMGIIGRDFFEGYLITIDCKKQELIISKGNLEKSDPNTLAYDEPFRIPIQIGKVKTFGNMDTGSNVSMHLPLKLADSIATSELKKAGQGRRANTVFDFMGGTVQDNIILAGNQINNLEVLFSELAPEVNIGMQLLKNYVVTIDQKNQLIQMLP
ncbi:MAG: aspartyl protease family protein [Saprospiraceae bacterium]|nr:aspartyl protease family protein [Saprospiraceae bacterium]